MEPVTAIAAIYARKSTDQSGVHADAKSVTRQVTHAREYARRKGWLVPEEHVFVDDGISGVEFAKRPGLLGLLQTLKPRAPFHFLIMSEESRLGREQIETGWILKQITDAGVRVFFYLEDRERTLDSAMDKMMMTLTNFASEIERERASQRTHDAMIRKAQAGHVTGGRVYGYDNLEIVSSALRADGRAQRQYVVRQVNPEQAAVVRRIFTLYASGIGITRIAKLLNDEGVTPPRQDRNGWAPTAIREILLRPLYRGEIVYNRTQKITKAGTKMQRKRPESDWHRLNVPDLRIISEDSWETVRSRFDRNRSAYPRRADGALLGRTADGDHGFKYLLSGLGSCSPCGGSFIAMTRSHGSTRAHFYGCAYYQKRGSAVCRNSLVIRKDLLDQAILEAIHKALDDRVVEDAIDAAIEMLAARHTQRSSGRLMIERELVESRAAQRRLIDAIKHSDQPLEPLVQALKAEELRVRTLEQQVETLADRDRVGALDPRRLAQIVRARAADVKAVLFRHTPEARRALRLLLRDRLRFTPVDQDGRRGYRFQGEGTYGGLLSGEAFPLTVVAPTEFEPVFSVRHALS